MINFAATKKVIDLWDPFGLIDFITPNEYDREIKRIVEKANKTNALTSEILANIIIDVFTKSFSGLFEKHEAECLEIARKVLESYK
ncbi:DUF1871 family protein [Clostridium manihotivorum]|uniref:DUF1871 family protein n=1 Tax=Clostridium manihotivorum TaxID=2320868 RepID=A0A3R5TI23_9CLOT|nr:DUF1871 family protein [Clostridium manihotivorum]QAA33939.1 hypothetical protein C1I91_21170 [Clostridium manihotivorum]